jgi:hypothetical protein
MQSNDEPCKLDIDQTPNEPALLELNFAQVHVNDILCLSNKPFEDKLEQLEAVFQQIRVNTNMTLCVQAAWKYSGYWISQGCNQLDKRNVSGFRQMSECELCCFGKMAIYFLVSPKVIRTFAHTILTRVYEPAHCIGKDEHVLTIIKT